MKHKNARANDKGFGIPKKKKKGPSSILVFGFPIFTQKNSNVEREGRWRKRINILASWSDPQVARGQGDGHCGMEPDSCLQVYDKEPNDRAQMYDEDPHFRVQMYDDESILRVQMNDDQS